MSFKVNSSIKSIEPYRDSQGRQQPEPVYDMTGEEAVLDEEDEATPQGCGILGRYPVVSVLLFASIGIAAGVGLSFWNPEDESTKDTALKWIGLIGDLFIRALKCAVLPLVFVNVIISVMEMMQVGKAGSVGWKTIVLYLVTTVMAALFGIMASIIMMPLYKQGTLYDLPPPTMTLGCMGEDGGSLLTTDANGNVYCSANYTEDDVNTQFAIVNSPFLEKAGEIQGDKSLSDSIYEGVFTKVVTDNIIESFSEGNFAAIVFFAIAFGVALSRVLDKMQRKGQDSSVVMSFLKEVDAVLLIIINWIIMITPCKYTHTCALPSIFVGRRHVPTSSLTSRPPFSSSLFLSLSVAVLSMITSAIGSQNNLGELFENVGYLVITTVIGMTAQFFVVYIGGFALITKSNPFKYLKHIVPAQTMAFASASSAATIPTTLKSVMATGVVPEPIARFVVPLGATVNMDGSAIYFPAACIWLAVFNGITPSVASYIMLAIIATIGSAGTAPVPSAGLILIATAYNTAFNTTGLPDGFSLIFAVDWFVDRLQTTLNVTGDAVVTGAVAHLCPLDRECEDSATEEGTGKEMDSSSSSSDECV